MADRYMTDRYMTDRYMADRYMTDRYMADRYMASVALICLAATFQRAFLRGVPFMILFVAIAGGFPLGTPSGSRGAISALASTLTARNVSTTFRPSGFGFRLGPARSALAE